jgi:serine/threonine-protein kinase
MHEITFKPGESCGNHRILSLIGIGGVAEVYKAAHRSSNAIVAIKVLRRFFADNLYLKEHMLSEAKLLSGLRHENVVHVEDLGIEEGTLWMAMEHLPGAPLRAFLQNGKPMPLPMALHFARGIAAGAGAAHQAGSLHRGLTPENIMIVGRNKVKVLDRSAAKLYGWDTKRTAKGVVFGSPLYMAPEHVRDEVLDPRSDVYALGLILYEMLTGRHPFAPSKRAMLSKHQICEMHIDVDPAPLTERLPGIPVELSNLVRRALSKDRYARPSSMQEFEQAIRSFMGTVVSDAPPVPSLRRITPRAPMSVPQPLPRDPRADEDDDRPTLVYHRDEHAPHSSAPVSTAPRSTAPRSTAPLSSGPPTSRAARSADIIDIPPDSTQAFLYLKSSGRTAEPDSILAALNRPPPLPFVEARPRTVREPVPSLPGLTAAARPRSSGAVSPFDLAYEAASASARRRLRRTSIALRVSAGVGTVVAVLALTYARLSAAPGGIQPIVKALASPFETAPEAVVAVTDSAPVQPAPASLMATSATSAPLAPPLATEKPAEPKATPVCRPTPAAVISAPAPEKAAKRVESSDPYEDVLLRPNPYDEDNVYDDKPAPPPKPAPRKKVNPFSPHGI